MPTRPPVAVKTSAARKTRPAARSGPTKDAATTRRILARLEKQHPNADTELNYRNPFELLAATILSAQCTDERVNQVTPILFARYGTPQPPKEDFEIFVCDADNNLITSYKFPYSKFARGNAKWVKFSVRPTAVPQQFLVDGATRKQLTNNEDMAPDLTAAPQQRFVVTRADGFNFRVTVTLPPGYQAGTRLPAIFWFYPREYSTQEAYDEPDRTFNKNSFQTFGSRSMAYLVRLGYALVEPDSPIVGPQGMMNNNYEHDLRNNLSVVIDELDRRGLIDRSRLALGGHSYGAFSTVNAMVHTPFFKAGIAGDGNYNRTLTPLGFQSERRIFWDARDVYVGMSPFFQANNLTGALLMYHGIHDQNVGTDPDN